MVLRRFDDSALCVMRVVDLRDLGSLQTFTLQHLKLELSRLGHKCEMETFHFSTGAACSHVFRITMLSFSKPGNTNITEQIVHKA